jgi:putative PEP-CTERM system histidine kinase
LFYRHGGARIEVSRQVAFKSVILFAVGLYLALFGFLGEGMQHFGASFPRTVSISFAFLLGIALLILLLSDKVQREVKVALQKNFYQHKHDYRTQWLRFSEQLSTSRSGEELLQRILAAYCEIFGISCAALFLYDQELAGFGMVSAHRMAMVDDIITSDNSLIHFMEGNAWVVCVRDENPEITAENRSFFSKNQISFVIPLFDGQRIDGVITLGKPIKANEIYIYEDYDLMKTIARQASLAILHQRLSEQILQAREIEAIGNVATFVVHDLKNQVSNLSLIVENAPKYIQHPDFQKDMLTSLDNTVTKMKRLIGRLKSIRESSLIDLQNVNLLELVQKTAATIAGGRVIVTGREIMAHVDEGEIQKVVLNLIMNGIEASVADNPVMVEVGFAERPYIRVADDGCGMTAQFIRTELFKPFKTSKNQGLGIGVYQCRKIVEAHGGKIDVQSDVGYGSKFTVWLNNDYHPA